MSVYYYYTFLIFDSLIILYVPPVFIPVRELPDGIAEFAICTAAFRSSGADTILGVQRIHQIWRLYAKSNVARVTLLAQGIEINVQAIERFSQHPYQGLAADGSEIPRTRLSLKDVPWSFSNDSMEECLIRNKVKIRSKLPSKQRYIGTI